MPALSLEVNMSSCPSSWRFRMTPCLVSNWGFWNTRVVLWEYSLVYYRNGLFLSSDVVELNLLKVLLGGVGILVVLDGGV